MKDQCVAGVKIIVVLLLIPMGILRLVQHCHGPPCSPAMLCHRHLHGPGADIWQLTAARGVSHVHVPSSCDTLLCHAGLMNALCVLPLGIGRQAKQASALPDDWALASAHESGAILVWDPHDGCIVPVAQLRPATGPCR